MENEEVGLQHRAALTNPSLERFRPGAHMENGEIEEIKKVRAARVVRCLPKAENIEVEGRDEGPQV